MAAIRVLIADEFPVVRIGIRQVLENATNIEIIAEAENGKEVLDLTKSLKPDVLLLSLGMPVINGFKVVMRLRETGMPVRILIFDRQEDTRVILELLQMGVYGYLLKDETAERILAAIRGAAKGEKGWLSRSIVHLISTQIRAEDNGHRVLTGREKQVLSAIMGGMSNQAIARDLGISQKTVEKHVSNIFIRLGVNSRTQAAVIAAQEHLV
jgi:DNA-binding NarL/FixJ family response regulator